VSAQVKILPPTIEVKDTATRKGLGVYALRQLKLDQLVERCPVIIFQQEEYGSLPRELRERLFNWSALVNKPSGQHAFALGYGSMYNHASPANLRYAAVRSGSRSTLEFSANGPIQIGEELTINYDEPGGSDPAGASAWMMRNNVEPV
jgi:SET domain-containing protein